MNKKIIALLIGATIISSNNAIAADTNVSTSKVAAAQKKVSHQINEFKNILGVMVPNTFFDNPADYDATTDWTFNQCGEKFLGSNNSSYCRYKLKIDSANVKVCNKNTAITNMRSDGQWVMKKL